MVSRVKRVMLWLMVIAILFITPITTVMAVNKQDVSISDTQEQILKAAELQVITNTLDHCLGSIKESDAVEKNIGKIFSGSTRVASGTWLEKQITKDETLDGLIKCKEDNGKILSLFAGRIGVHINDILCNAENPNLPGIVQSAEESWSFASDSSAKQVTSSFSESNCDKADKVVRYTDEHSSGTLTFNRRTYKSGREYLRLLYEKYYAENENKNPYLVSWEDWDNMRNFESAVTSYQVLKQDFEAACGVGQEMPNSWNGKYMAAYPIIDMDSGTYFRRLVKYEYSQVSGVVQSPTGTERMCGDFSRALNLQFPLYYDAIKKAYRENCSATVTPVWEYEKKISDIIVSGTTKIESVSGNEQFEDWTNEEVDANGNKVAKKFTDEEKQNAQTVINDYNRLKGNEFFEETYVEIDNDGNVVKTDDGEIKYVNAHGNAAWFCAAPPGYNLIMQQSSTDFSSTDACYNSGIEGMSWVLCPVISNSTSAVDAIDNTLNDWLSVDSSDYDNASDAYTTWEIFRNIANILIAIILLVVIFSQLTGYGIDNYGIKKMLPRLLVMAVIINLSFLICQLAIDLSNIAGASLSSLLESIGKGLPTGVSSGNVIATIVASLFGAVAGAGATGSLILVSLTASGGPMVVISLVLALLSALVTVLMFFVTLGARMVIVIIFSALSPLAFASYILPNTQFLFKKWWNIFKIALLIYPICGALYGMSFIIRSIVLSSNEIPFWMAIIGIIAPFLPFLLLPSLMQGALAALGKLGGTLSTIGSGLRKGIDRGNQAIQNTDAYKSNIETFKRKQNARHAGFQLDKDGKLKLDKDGNPIRKNANRFTRFMYGGESAMAQAGFRALKDQETILAENNMLSGSGLNAAYAGVEEKSANQAIANAQSMLTYGRAKYADSNGNMVTVNANNAGSLGAYHMAALKKYNKAKSATEKADAMAEVKAAQNLLAKTSAGQEELRNNFATAAAANMSGLASASSHLFSEHGNILKANDRGTHRLIQDIATAATGDDGEISSLASIQSNLLDGTYDKAGIDKYTSESLVDANPQAIRRLANAYHNGSMKDYEKETLRNMIVDARKMKAQGKLSVKPEIEAEIKKIDPFF